MVQAVGNWDIAPMRIKVLFVVGMVLIAAGAVGVGVLDAAGAGSWADCTMVRSDNRSRGRVHHAVEPRSLRDQHGARRRFLTGRGGQ